MEYSDAASAGVSRELPKVEAIRNEYGSNYEITIVVKEFTSICPKTGLPDFGVVTIRYVPGEYYVELKSLKYYFLGYRNLGIFYENLVNKILHDLRTALKPVSMEVVAKMGVRGGIYTIVTARFPETPPKPYRYVSYPLSGSHGTEVAE